MKTLAIGSVLSWPRVLVVLLGLIQAGDFGNCRFVLAEDSRRVFEEARVLAEDGQVEAAVLKYLSVPDGEFAALQAGRAEASRVLKMVREKGDAIPVARRRLVEGELLLALRDRAGALQAFRDAAAKIAVKEGVGWEQGLLPRDRYFVELPNEHARGWMPSGGVPLSPFTLGPGSHRDNWLLRRFIALELWDDAAKEFARVWELHRETLEPSVVQIPTGYDEQRQPTAFDRWLVQPAGFSGAGLQFALDYAFFLQRREQLDRARDVLLEAALRIDMDRNPNNAAWPPSSSTARRLSADEVPGQGGLPKLRPVESVSRGHHVGVSRTSFLRLAFGFLKSHGQEERLVEQLTKRIDAGENRLRRVLAQVRLQQGEPDAAKKLELEYIAAAKFDPVTTAYRRAAVFESAQQIREAVTECEAVLSLLDRNDTAPMLRNFPDPLEPDPETDMWAARVSQFALPFMGFLSGAPNQALLLRGHLWSRLERMYSSLGETDKSLDAARRQILVGGAGRSVSVFDELARKHRAVGKEAEFLAWAKERLGEMTNRGYVQDFNIRANLLWLIGDRQLAAESFAKVESKYDLAAWKERYRAAGPDALRMFLKALVAANPKDAQSQWELLELDGKIDETRLAERLELLLEADPRQLFWRGKGARQKELPYKDQFEIAYRLMRLYERAKEFDKLHSLGVRIARGDKPFDQVNWTQYDYRDSNALPESANGALALAIQWADTEQKTSELAAALENSKWRAAKAQLARKLDESKSEPPAAIGWANLPRGVNLIASNENVLSLTNDDRFVYAGHPWGVAVYDFTGKPITRIALGEAALTLATTVGDNRVAKTGDRQSNRDRSPDADVRTNADPDVGVQATKGIQEHYLWVGTPKGLLRIVRSDWSVAHQWMHDWMLPKDRDVPFGSNEGFPYSYLDNRVNTLTVDGDDLWIGMQRTIQRLNLKTLELRAFSVEELKVSSWADCERIVLDGRYVWADSNHSGLRRYDRETDEWSVPEPIGPREPVRLVGIIDGRVFGDVWVNDQLRHRLCLIDRQTLATSVIPVAVKKEEQLINSPLRYFGRYRDHLAFGTYGPSHVLDDAAGKLKPIRSVVESLGERIRERSLKRNVDESLAGVHAALDRFAEYSDLFRRGDLFGQDDSAWRIRRLPDGTLVLGSRQDRVRFEYSTEERATTSASAQHEIKDQVGGLFFVKPGGSPIRVSSLPRADAILGDQVQDVIATESGAWLCTSLGAARVDRDDRVRERFTRANGLCSNRVTGCVELNAKTYFSTAWGDSGGGLAIYEPATSLFTSIGHEDGLPTDKLDSVQVVGQQLRLNFGQEYLRFNAVGEQRYRQFRPAMFDPKTQTVTAVGEPRLMSQNEASATRQRLPLPKWMPYLGGFATKSMPINGRTYQAGLRGVVISDGPIAEPKFAELGAKISAASPTNDLADAESRPVEIQSPDELATALKDNNPLYRANALASLLKMKSLDAAYLPLIASQLNSRNVRLRSTALYFVTKVADDEQVVPLLKAQLETSDRPMRMVAVVELARRGHLVPEKLLSEIIDSDRSAGNYPFGAKSSVGVIADREQLIKALAPRANSAVLRLLLNKPPSFQVGYNESEQIFAQLGESLRRDPSSADVLLKAHDSESHHTEQRNFARDVFLAAGKPLLPRLHEALKSDDRVIRSNAARACGAIADPSSLQPLLKAIELESALSRASIVWALGRLKSAEALPLLAKLYAEAKAAQSRVSQANMRYAQQSAAVTSHYQRIVSLESLTAEWNELKESALSPVANPRDEELLRPEHILQAVAEIGPEKSQEFYRALAASPDSSNRDEGAGHLSVAIGEDRSKSLAILKNLLKDDALSVRTRAAVSLIQLDDLSGRDVLLDALKSKDPGDKYHVVHQLARLQERGQLEFAKEHLQAIAADHSLVPGLREFTNNLLKRIQP